MAVGLEEMLRAVSSGAELPGLDRAATLTDQVYDRLRHGLLVGQWDPGEKITARKVCKELGVSLTPAREAMMRLVNEGALDVALNRTYSAASLTLEQYREIANIRLALEPMAAEAAAARIPEARIAQLEQLNEELVSAIREERFRDAIRVDSELHLSTYRESGQPTLCAIIDRLWLRAGPTRNRLSHAYRKTLAGYENHKTLIAALRARDGAKAREIITHDLQQGTQAVMAMLQADG